MNKVINQRKVSSNELVIMLQLCHLRQMSLTQADGQIKAEIAFWPLRGFSKFLRLHISLHWNLLACRISMGLKNKTILWCKIYILSLQHDHILYSKSCFSHLSRRPAGAERVNWNHPVVVSQHSSLMALLLPVSQWKCPANRLIFVSFKRTTRNALHWNDSFFIWLSLYC